MARQTEGVKSLLNYQGFCTFLIYRNSILKTYGNDICKTKMKNNQFVESCLFKHKNDGM